jgi:murein DD-endopeptidase MepM/ murein hydrolase activator NlpD
VANAAPPVPSPGPAEEGGRLLGDGVAPRVRADSFDEGPPLEEALLAPLAHPEHPEHPEHPDAPPPVSLGASTERTDEGGQGAPSSRPEDDASAPLETSGVRPPAPPSVIRPPVSSYRHAREVPPAAPRAIGSSGFGTRYPLPQSIETPTKPPLVSGPPGGMYLSPRMTAIFGGLFGLATVTSVIALLIQVVPPRDERAIIAGTSPSASGSASTSAALAKPEVKKRQRIAIPGPWRVSELEKDPATLVATATMDRKSLMDALGDKGVPKAQVYRIMKAFDGVRKFDKSARKDRFTVAMERSTRRVRAFEYAVSGTEIYQSREGSDGLLSTGAKLDLKIAEAEFIGAFYVGSDLGVAATSAGFEDGLFTALDEALSGRISSESFEEGGTVRVIAVEETALGLFARYKRIIAAEYRPPDPSAKPVRVYTFNGQDARGYWDDRGKQPYAGGWRSPVPGAPVTSRFNPKRMHPILHKIMPHQGTDFGATMGTPVYSAYRGVVSFVGPHGATGNWVGINHPNGVETGYAHLSRFAAGLKAGDKVGTHQLVGYVGSTGRSTAPHLHFSARKNGVFFDAETLQLDGERPVPVVDRQAFLAAKAELDRRLDAIPLPEPPPEQPKPVAAAGSLPTSAPEAPPEGAGALAKGGRHAVIVGSPAAIASAAAEPGIHPKSFVEDTGEDDEDPAAVPAPPGATQGKPGIPPDPAESEEDDEER